MLRSFGLVFIITHFLAVSGVAQSSGRQTVNQPVEWFALGSSIKVHKRVSIFAEGQFRYVRTFEPMQFQFRTGVDLSINKQLYIMPLGYVYSWNPLYGKQPATFVNNEHRTFEQVLYKHSIGRVNISHRLRLEQRFMQVHEYNNGEIVNEGYGLHSNRIRYRLMANIPVNHKKMEAKTVYVSLYDEAFLSWGKSITYNEPDQNRVFAGMGYQVNKLFSVQGGFFYQLLIKANGTKQENNVGMQFQVNYNVDLTKKEQ